MLEVSSSLPQRVRSTCGRVAKRARWVRIDFEAIARYATSITVDASETPSLDPEHHYIDGGPDTVTFILALDAINFGSGYFPHLERLDGLSGYFTVAQHLTEYFRDHAPISADRLAALTPADCARIFGQTPDDADRAELMRLFAAALNELGAFVGVRYGGSFTALVEDARHSPSRLVGILAQMSSFDDVADYRGDSVAFLKRAQIAVSDLNLAFAGQAWGAFDDLSDLTVFADNVLPHVLRTDGVLRYSADLGSRIDRVQPLEAGSDQEVEVRACTVDVCEHITAAIRERNPGFTARDLDYLLWNRGRLPRYKSLPRHRCKTMYY
jgi:hypothetical protein